MKASKKGTPNFRWTHVMSQFLVTFLVEQARAGFKVGKSFKRPALVAAAKAISEKFNVLVTESHVENRMRTLKNRFAQIQKLREMSDVEWDDDDKKVIMDPRRCAEHVVANPKDEPFVNKTIDFYEEMCIICGDYQATKGFVKGLTDEISDEALLMICDNTVPTLHNLKGTEDDDMVESTKPTPTKGASSTSTEKLKHCGGKRKRDSTVQMIQELASKIGELAAAIRNNQGQQMANDLYKAVMKCEGYSEDSLELAFDYLMEHETWARSFMAKTELRRQAWVSRFISSRQG
uniref:Peptide deformylase 1 n=1 Tax=Anthurium amnicola TaxID=1678845 RepID=A0A1D1YDQ9_9ARAE